MVVNDVHQASMTMARAYHERYPMLLDWANAEGKTALHVAASAGNEDFARLLCDLGADFDLPDLLGNTPLHYASAWGHSSVAQLLIHRGCQYLARNNQGFTAADFAFSQNTKDELEQIIRSLIESNKKLRRAQSAAAREDWNRVSMDGSVSSASAELYAYTNGRQRVRSLSNASRTTSSEDTDYGGPVDLHSTPARSLRPQNSKASVASVPVQFPDHPSGTFSTTSINSSSSSRAPSMIPTRTSSHTSPETSPPDRVSLQTETPRAPAAPFPSKSTPRGPAISPVAHRIQEKDQGAIAQFQEYMNRKRTGSGNTVNAGHAGHPLPPLPQPKSSKPRLRTSASAAVLLSPTSATSLAGAMNGADPRAMARKNTELFDPHATPRHRAETMDTVPIAKGNSPTPTTTSASTEGTLRRVQSPLLTGRAPARSKEVTPWEFGSSDEDGVPPAARRTESS
ncbi:hypothetical protein DACRYDRAFT_60896 [Dacryopinax primogenitus]|uniref:Uncharacterized protein n=1 Tax=Dacryopinax primogenitus (strain DJM 731) TaxID=1858805 RepID=M5GCJ3_DACPD|nr:uncharacterized protein DACRYDRAFT_60896 [Dacryopinax primogenitus]EJU06245.1 hypothetical protein DACRYDRAFT_60896 [Dacryopinax primogenitus]